MTEVCSINVVKKEQVLNHGYSKRDFTIKSTFEEAVRAEASDAADLTDIESVHFARNKNTRRQRGIAVDGVFKDDGSRFEKVGRKRVIADSSIESINEADLPHR